MEPTENYMNINWRQMIRWVALILCIAMIGCASLPIQTTQYSEEVSIEVGDGPEDFQLDKENNRMLIACDNRRVGYGLGEIWEIDLESQKPTRIEVVFKENNVKFHPHGMSIVDNYLFVISHRDKNTEEFFRFKIYKDSVVEDTIFRDGIIGHANDIFAVSKDEFYYSDFKMFGGSIIHFKDGVYEKFVKGFKYPNGLYIHNNQMYVTTSMSNKLFQIDMSSHEKKAILKLKGGDNLLSDGNYLFTASHPKMMKFVKHTKSRTNTSPTVIYSIDLNTYEKKVLFSNDGEKISAGSTAFVHQGKIYIGQVFEDRIWVGTIK